MKKLIAAMVMAACAVWQAGAGLITFEDLPGDNWRFSDPSTTYQGLYWGTGDAFDYMRDVNGHAGWAHLTGYETLAIQTGSSIVCVREGGNGYSSSALRAPTGSTFTFNSAYFAEGWLDNGTPLSLRVQGFRSGSQLPGYDYTLTLTTVNATFFTFPDVAVDQIVFTGTRSTGGRGHFAMDNVTINAVPEPTHYALMAFFLLGVARYVFRRYRFSKAA